MANKVPRSRAALAAALVLLSGAATMQLANAFDQSQLETMLAASFTNIPDGWASRLQQDETQRICSISHNKPSAEDAEKIVKAETAKVKVPEGSLVGDWKEGEKVARNSRGNRFNDPPGTVAGGNCYACHELDPAELAFGTIGPSLKGYGKDRDYDPEYAKAAYIKIFDAQASFACSLMPRFGANGVLTEQQIKDVIGYLFDPDSPVNK